ncbi:MAG: hypothetical protein AB7I50_03380 [Vicinamibacterales bacterium]
MKQRLLCGVLVCAVAVGLASVRPASAQSVVFRGGATVDPDQGFFGMSYVTAPLSGELRLQPGADLGFGNDVILSAIHIDFAQWFTLNPRWQLYFGGGPAVNIYRFDVGDSRGGESTTDVQGGFDTLVGFAHESGATFEIRIGSNGSPNLRFAVGYGFGR